ncbi:MAG: DUF2723 domain-containing protein [Myxococcales bacterium]|nr:DUF2723 domain-containing protein [Myxococcales bacterium]MCB9709202.1 DUF2723 domain-containing protein [Myxococcales bacterium]
MQRYLNTRSWRALWMSAAGMLGVWHAASGPHLYDAGELTASAWLLGASHPPGQPLHALLAHFFSWLPLGPIPWRIALLSVGTELLAAWYVIQIVRTLQSGATATAPPLASSSRASTLLADLVHRVAPDAAAMGFLLSGVVLRQALRVEVYGIAVALSLYGTQHAIRWMYGARQRDLCHAVFAGALCTTAHLPHAIAPAAMLLCAIFVVPPRRWVTVTGICTAAVAAALGLAFWSWLPLRALAGAPMWGHAQTWQGFWEYVSARAYQRNLGVQGHTWLSQVLDAFGFSIASAGILPVVGMGLWALLAARGRAPFRYAHVAVMVGTFLAIVAGCIQPLEPSNPDNVAYFAPAVALFLALGTSGFACWSHSQQNQVLAAAALLLTALNIPALFRVPEILDAELPALETYSGLLSEAPPPKALVIVETDFTGGALMMAQAVDGARPDIALFVSGLATSSWHWHTLRSHSFFDGTPRRGQGRDARMAYNDGIVRFAYGHVPVVSEAHWPTRGQGLILGPYVYLPVDRHIQESDLRRTMAERWSEAFGRDVLTSPLGDHGAAMAVLRYYEVTRAKRLVFRDRTAEALEALRFALGRLPREQLRLLSGATVQRTLMPPPAVREPGAFLISKEDAVREAATLLWSMGAADHARELLRFQLKRGDMRSVLQLAWLEVAEGNLESARRTYQAFVTVAPELSQEAQPLERHLR